MENGDFQTKEKKLYYSLLLKKPVELSRKNIFNMDHGDIVYYPVVKLSRLILLKIKLQMTCTTSYFSYFY